MATVYIMESQSTGKYYIGSSTDLSRRLSEHERGHSSYTRGGGPWKLVYQEQYASLFEARRREKDLKNWKSHRSIRELIEGKGRG